MRLFANANYPFIAWRRPAYAISAALIVLSLVPMAYHAVRGEGWIDYGIDFEGGVLMQVRFHEARSVEEIRAALEGTGAQEISRLGRDSEFVIRAPLDPARGTNATTEAIASALNDAFPADRLEVVRTDAVGPRVGDELESRAAMAVGISFLLTLVYLAFRFEPRFGLAAVLATAHDVIVTLGFLALFRVEIGVTTVASILTVVGYSLNDTIVVFDRIREKLRSKGHAREGEQTLVNRAINETLPRTILTSGTTVAVLAPLYVIGGAVLRDFAQVLILGIVVGTYSSVFVAAPALLAIRNWRMARAGAVAAGARDTHATGGSAPIMASSARVAPIRGRRPDDRRSRPGT